MSLPRVEQRQVWLGGWSPGACEFENTFLLLCGWKRASYFTVLGVVQVNVESLGSAVMGGRRTFFLSVFKATRFLCFVVLGSGRRHVLFVLDLQPA